MFEPSYCSTSKYPLLNITSYCRLVFSAVVTSQQTLQILFAVCIDFFFHFCSGNKRISNDEDSSDFPLYTPFYVQKILYNTHMYHIQRREEKSPFRICIYLITFSHVRNAMRCSIDTFSKNTTKSCSNVCFFNLKKNLLNISEKNICV